MQIKVKDTKMHTLYGHIPHIKATSYEIPVAEAKLVLSTTTLPKFYDTVLPSERGQYLKPILISETEKIEVGDLAYNWGVKRFGKVISIENGNITTDNDQYIDTSSINNFAKVLALPEHFSPKHLQAIVDGKLRDGMTVLIECEETK